MNRPLYSGLFCIALSLGIFSAMISCSQKKIQYPAAPQDDTVDEYFGVKVSDPYRPLENDTASETLAWVEAENKVTQDYLSNIPYRNKIRERLTQLQNYPKYGMPWKAEDGRYYMYRNDGLSNQSILYRADSAMTEP